MLHFRLESGGDEERRVEVFDGVTSDGQVLRWMPATPIPDIVRIRVITTSLIDLEPAWREILVYGG